MPPKNTLWPLGNHTPAKHVVLRRYLDAWLPILGFGQQRILFIDGFAGPGRYEGGEDGSPVIAVKAFVEHTARSRIQAEVKFLFIEGEEDRARFLEGVLEPYKAQLPPGSEIQVITGKFDETLGGVLASIEEANKRLAPAFVMIDPFGVSDTPLSIIAKILQNPKSEIYVSFMYEAINRFKTADEFAPHLDELFGTVEWRIGIAMEDPTARKDFLYGLYERQLRAAGAKYVVRFELYDGNRLVYAIFFATKHSKGCAKMKEAIWKIAPFGDYQFRGNRHGQITLGLGSLDYAPLGQEILAEFGDEDWVSIEKLQDWVRSDKTDYCESHLKKALKALEHGGKIEADLSTRTKSGTYPPGTLVRVVGAGDS